MAMAPTKERAAIAVDEARPRARSERRSVFLRLVIVFSLSRFTRSHRGAARLAFARAVPGESPRRTRAQLPVEVRRAPGRAPRARRPCPRRTAVATIAALGGG